MRRDLSPLANSGWQQEISLDVEWAHAIAPGAKIMLVEASSSSTRCLCSKPSRLRSRAGHRGLDELGRKRVFRVKTTDDAYFVAPGVTFVASAGDSGAGVEWPAASPNVVGVGGTTLVLTRLADTGRKRPGPTAGGGISVYETPQPVWQNGWFQPSWTPVNRGVPDVSYLANPNDGGVRGL